MDAFIGDLSYTHIRRGGQVVSTLEGPGKVNQFPLKASPSNQGARACVSGIKHVGHLFGKRYSE